MAKDKKGRWVRASASVVRAARKRFQVEAVDRAEDIDPFNELDWLSLATGFYVACGLSPDQAFVYGDRDVAAASGKESKL